MTRTIRLLLVGFFASGTLAFGCSSSTEDRAGDDPTAIVKDWVLRRSAAQCAATRPCCETAALPHDEDACRDALTPVNWVTAKDLLDAGGTFHPDVAEQCIQETLALDCNQPQTEPRICDYVIWGTTPQEDPCESDFECAPAPEGYPYCAFNGCHAHIPNGGLGAPCAGVSTVYECAEGLACATIAGVCVEGPASGDECNSSSQCPNGDRCPWPAGADHGFCTPRDPVGSPCEDFPDTCVPGARCVAGECQLGLPPTAKCAQSSDCQGGSCDPLNGRCSFYDWCISD